MQRLSNAQRAQIFRALADARAPTRYGEVDGYDPKTYCATVIIQPEGIKTGWLPIMAWGSGGGWGDYWGLLPGTQVALSHFEGDRDNGLILGITPNEQEQPPQVPGGEKWTVHKSGSFLKFTNDGKVALNTQSDLTATVGGKLNATIQSDANLNVSGKTVLTCNDVELGASGGKKVVLDGDPVIGGGGGTVQASSTKVKAT